MGEQLGSMGHLGNQATSGGGGSQSGLNAYANFLSAYNSFNTNIKDTIDKALSDRPFNVIMATFGLDSIFSAAATSGGFRLESLAFLKFAPLDLLNFNAPTPNALISGRGGKGGMGR